MGTGRDQEVLGEERCAHRRFGTAADRSAIEPDNMPSPRAVGRQLIAEFACAGMRSRPPVVDEPKRDHVADSDLGAPAVRTHPHRTERVWMGNSGIRFVTVGRLQLPNASVALPTEPEQNVVIESELRDGRRQPVTLREHGERVSRYARAHEQLDVDEC